MNEYNSKLNSIIQKLMVVGKKGKKETIIDFYKFRLLKLGEDIPMELRHIQDILWKNDFRYSESGVDKEDLNAYLLRIEDLSDIEREEIILKLI
jgi:hypothetical protein